MARINLLPWREELRERKNKEFITLVIGILLLGLALAFAVWTFFNNELSEQRIANDGIIAENAKLDAQLAEIETLEQRREEIISRMTVVQDLQGKRPLPVRIWDDVARAIPQNMYLTTFQRTDDTLSFTGKADNPNVVSALVRNLDASDWLGNSKVSFIKQNITAYQETPTISAEDADRAIYPEDSYIDFVVTTQVINTSVAEDTEGDVAADTTGEQ